jgi:predicted short-subunit dehydrogenase-like oxidoreductase (DUF2520 family)
MIPVSIVGSGRVGSALGRALRKAGWPVVAVATRTVASGKGASQFVGAPAMSAGDAAAAAKLVIVAVPDDAVAAVAREIAPRVRRGATVLHTSGALTSDALAPVRRRGARAASLHPLMTVPDPERGARALKGAWFFHEGDPGTAPVLRALVRALGGRAVPVRRAGKILYHAGAVLACNDLTALLDAAFRCFARAGISERTARAALGPLVRATRGNALLLGPRRALTGPVARGDAGTLARHLRALPPDDRALYRALAIATARLAPLPPARRRAILKILSGGA